MSCLHEDPEFLAEVRKAGKTLKGLEGDDHYIADLNNAHIGTKCFQNWLKEQFADNGPLSNEQYRLVYDEIVDKLADPEEPGLDDLICRYFTPLNFLRFVGHGTLHFARASGFDDTSEGLPPSEYINCVSAFLAKKHLPGDTWKQVLKKMGDRWLVSCWTKLVDHYDDYLLWHTYTGSRRYGVGITVRYHRLRNHLRDLHDERKSLDVDVEEFVAGKVDYIRSKVDYIRSEQWVGRKPPFNKHRRFRKENEVRFCFRANGEGSLKAPVDDLKRCFGLRFSPDAPKDYVCSVRKIWKRWGGADRCHIEDQEL